jgi:hypothetical protein
MPEADFCSAVRSPYGHLSRRSDTEQISWGKFSHFPCTVAESTFRTLMDMDFAVSRPLVRYGRLLFGFCPSTRTFVPCFLQTPPHGGSPCIITSPFLHQDGQRTFTSWLLNMPSTRLSRWRGGRLACTSLIRRWSVERLTVREHLFGTPLSMARQNCIDKDRAREYCRRTRADATGASSIIQITH